MLRYFAHRTGVKPRNDQKTYLEDELNKAMSTAMTLLHLFKRSFFRRPEKMPKIRRYVYGILKCLVQA